MSLAAETRQRIREHPFLRVALRAGVVNYSAAADFLDVDGEREAVATALRRYAGELPPFETEARDVRVRMRSEVGLRETASGAADSGDGGGNGTYGESDENGGDGEDGEGGTDVGDGEAFVSVGGRTLVPNGGSLTAVTATGEVDATALATALSRLSTADVVVEAAGVAGGTLVVVVPGRQGATALRTVESALDAVPAKGHNP